MCKGERKSAENYTTIQWIRSISFQCKTVEWMKLFFVLSIPWNRFFHSFFFRLVGAFSEIMEFIFAVIFSWSIASICFNMLILQIELVKCIRHGIFIELHNHWSTQRIFKMYFHCSNSSWIIQNWFKDAIKHFLHSLQFMFAANSVISCAKRLRKLTITLANYIGINFLCKHGRCYQLS